MPTKETALSRSADGETDTSSAPPRARGTEPDVYRLLLDGFQLSACAGFDAHVLASVLALAMREARAGTPLASALGLDPPEIHGLFDEVFPHAAPLLEGLDPSMKAEPSEDERWLRDLLLRGSVRCDRLEQWLAAIIARRAQRPDHLWQELGLRNRKELSWLLERHFEPLASRNTKGMRWKKFMYRQICRDNGFTLCPAPSCSECSDYDECFGPESDEGSPVDSSVVHEESR